jgi:hypothetical protein
MLRRGIDIRYIVNCSGGTMWRSGNENSQENRETVHVRAVIDEQQKKAPRSKYNSGEPVLRLCGVWAVSGGRNSSPMP